MSQPTSPAGRPRFSVAWGAAISLAGFGAARVAGAAGLSFVFGLLTVVLGVVLGGRALAAWQHRLLWRVRHRLLAAYLFIGVIPVVLLLLMGLVAAWTLYANVAVSLVTDQLQGIESDLDDEASDVAAALEVAGAMEGRLRPTLVARIVETHLAHVRERLPRVEIQALGNSAADRAALPGWLRGQRFSGVLMGEEAGLVSSIPVQVARQSVTVVVRFPLDAGALEMLGRDIGAVTLYLLGEEAGGPGSLPVGSKRYRVLKTIGDARQLSPPVAWWDREIGFLASQPTRQPETGEPDSPLVLVVRSRVAALNRQLASRLGEFSSLPVTIFGTFAALFLALELVALWIGVKLTRTITATVNDLQVAVEQVQAANFSHRIRLRGRDQLSGLAQAFNSMASSIEGLIEELQEKQRLQSELEIARQVQEQLFPRQAPQLETLELAGRCQPARLVSGDYYDYGLAGPGKLIFTIGDICGKGISAALLMATIQSILRSHGYASRLRGQAGQLDPAELVTRVNRQLCATTSPEKYSTLFLACYDDSTRRLTYTNAGHLPPVLLRRGRSQQLTVGGPVVGLFPDLTFEQGSVELQQGDWLVAFTDGLTEMENSYEEEYGSERLVEFLQRAADSSTPERLVDALLAELQQWAPGVELRDDCTVLAARAR